MDYDISSIRESGGMQPPRVVLHGPPGVGKSTFFSQAPSPIFIPTEDGLRAIKVPAFPLVTDLAQMDAALNTVLTGQHNFQTLVIDSADWTEDLFKKQVAKDYGLKEYDSQARDLAYGRGTEAIYNYLERFLQDLDKINAKRGMAICLIAHSKIRKFDDPMNAAYDTYSVDMGKGIADKLMEWADIIGFANTQTFVQKEKTGFGSENTKAKGSGKSILHLSKSPAFMAKSRWPMPREMDLSYPLFHQSLLTSMQQVAGVPQATNLIN